MKRGIDVSTYQKNIQWERVAASGIDFAMLKATQGKSEQNPSVSMFTDSTFVYNITQAKNTNIRFGVYHYLTAATTEEARREADYFLSVITPYKAQISLYAAVDVESRYLPTDRTLLSRIVEVFCKAVQKAGFVPMVYTNPAFLASRLTLAHNRLLWLALWRDPKNPPTEKLYPGLTLWQYGRETVSGISGSVDVNFMLAERIETPPSSPSAPSSPSTLPSPDSDTPSDWAREAVSWCQKEGILLGDASGKLHPKNPVTREEAAMLLYRLYHLIEKKRS